MTALLLWRALPAVFCPFTAVILFYLGAYEKFQQTGLLLSQGIVPSRQEEYGTN
jgi:general stress protein CsbA